MPSQNPTDPETPAPTTSTAPTTPTPRPTNEAARQQALDALRILDTDPDPRFDRIVRIASRLFGVPIARISFADRDRIWYKAGVGLSCDPRPRDQAICGYSILSDQPLIVRNLEDDPRFRHIFDFSNENSPRFYAGAPLRLKSGERVGALCLMDRQARPDFSAEDAALLTDLATMAVHELELHKQIATLAEQNQDAMLSLEQAEAARERFLAVMSHELRTPLNAIAGLSTILLNGMEDPEFQPAQHGYVHAIRDSSFRLERLIGRVLTYAAARDGDLQLTEAPCDLVSLCRSCCEASRMAAALSNVDVEFATNAGDSLPVLIDEVQVTEMLHQLLGNAVRASSEGQCVTVRLVASEAGPTITVADQGQGLSQDAIDQLASTFAQGREDACRTWDGIGLGLPLTGMLAQLHGATLDFPDTQDRGGLTARLIFPSWRYIGREDTPPVAEAG